jgi:hypothetical protein
MKPVCVPVHNHKSLLHTENVKDMGSPFGPLQLSREIVIVNCISRRALRRCLMSAVVGVCVLGRVGEGIPIDTICS